MFPCAAVLLQCQVGQWEGTGMQKRPGMQGDVVASGRSGFACLCVQQAVLDSEECLDLCVAASIYFHSQCVIIY